MAESQESSNVIRMMKIVELPDDRADREEAIDRHVTLAQYEQLLQDPGQVNSPLLSCLDTQSYWSAQRQGRSALHR